MTIFDSAGEEIYNLLRDSYFRFTKTPEYHRLTHKSLREPDKMLIKPRMNKEKQRLSGLGIKK